MSANARPVVGIAGAGYVVPRLWGELSVRGIPTSYVDAVAAAGGCPVILPPGHALGMLDALDAVVLAGGDHIGAAPERDDGETALLHAARERSLPLLGVCRGLQLLAVADGGTLIPDLGPDLPHVVPDRGHPVTTARGSVLASLLGPTATVSSLHHQGVANLGTGWQPTAHAADGLIEGTEWGGGWDALGVQWHPEKDHTGPALFGWLVRAAARCRSAAVAAAATSMLLVGCGSDDPGPSTAPEDRPSTSTTTEAPAVSALEGSWRTHPVTVDETVATIRRHGLAPWITDYRANAPFSGGTVLLLSIENGQWNLYGESDGQPAAPIDYDAEYEIDGDTVTFHHSDGSNTYRWTVDGDTLQLEFVGTTFPVIDGEIPEEVFQRALYMTAAFMREG